MSTTHPAQITETTGGVTTSLASKLDSLDAGILALQTLMPSWDSLPAQYVMGHRGTNNASAPENTFASFDVAAALGVPIETDVQTCVNGVLVHLHDNTIDRTTGTANNLNVRFQTFGVLKTLDFSVPFPGPGSMFVPQRIPTFEEYLRKYRGNLLIPEVKDEQPATGTAMANLVVKYGMQRSVVITCFSTPSLLAAIAVDPTIKTLWANAPAPTVLAASAVPGLWGISSSLQSIDGAYVATMHAAGYKVHVYNLALYPKDVDTVIGYGVDGIYADDPAYVSLLFNKTKTPGTTIIDPPAAVFQAGGWLWFGSVANTPTVASGFSTFSGVTLGAGSFFRVQIPARTAVSPGTQTITTTLKAVQGNGDATRFMGVRFAWDRDDDIDVLGGGGLHTPNGYYFLMRQNGGVEVWKAVNGAGTQLATATWASYAIGASIPIRINVFPTSFTVTRTDNSQTITGTDSSLPRGGMMTAFGSGMVPGIGSTTITY